MIILKKSIITNDLDHCFICGTVQNLELHHVFISSNRTNSDRYGLTVRLCNYHHQDHKNGVHHNAELMQQLHEVGQKAFEKKHGTRADFIRIFGKNFLDDDPAWDFDKK